MEPYTQPIRRFAQDHKISPTRIYEWIEKGELESVLIGKRRHIIVPSYHQMIERRRAEQAGVKLPSSNPKAKERQAAAAQAPTPPRHAEGSIAQPRRGAKAPPKRRSAGRRV